jgi:tetratricopeptide (TPR) repeat protein
MTNFEELDALWQKRHDTVICAQLENAVLTALGTTPREYSLLWRAARYFHFRAMQCDEDKDAQQARAYFSQGVQSGRGAMEVNANEVEGCFWCGVNEIEAARHTSTLATLATLGKASARIERAAKIDESFHFAGPLRVMGRIIHRKPLLLGGSAGVAIEYFKRALQLAPDNSTTQIYYAEALLTEQQKPEARRVLNDVLHAPDDESWKWEQSRDRKIAQQMLEAMSAH